MTRVADYMKGRLFRIILIGTVVYAVAAVMTEAPFLILILNGLVLSVAAGVCVAYAPVVMGSIANPYPSKGDYLGAGIFFGWASIVIMRFTSIMARDFGWPDLYNTDWTTFYIFLAFMGGLFHLWAPNAVEGRVPRSRWVATGIIVSIGLFIAFGLWSAHTAAPLVRPSIQLQ